MYLSIWISHLCMYISHLYSFPLSQTTLKLLSYLGCSEWIRLQWTWSYRYFFEILFSFPLAKWILRTGIPGSFSDELPYYFLTNSTSDVKRWLIGKDPAAGKDWEQEEKVVTEDEIVAWHHQLNGYEFDQIPEVG